MSRVYVPILMMLDFGPSSLLVGLGTAWEEYVHILIDEWPCELHEPTHSPTASVFVAVELVVGVSTSTVLEGCGLPEGE